MHTWAPAAGRGRDCCRREVGEQGLLQRLEMEGAGAAGKAGDEGTPIAARVGDEGTEQLLLERQEMWKHLLLERLEVREQNRNCCKGRR